MHLMNEHLKQSGILVNCKLFKFNINLHFKLHIVSWMLCLGRFLPLLIGDLVEEENTYWKKYLAHFNILGDVFSPFTSRDRTEYVD